MPNAGIQPDMMPPDISAPGAEFGCIFTDLPIASITQLEEGKKRNDTSNNISAGAFAYESWRINRVKAVNPGTRAKLDANQEITAHSVKDLRKDMQRIIITLQSELKVQKRNLIQLNFIEKLKMFTPNSTYKAKISLNSKVDIKLVLEVLSFRVFERGEYF
ncbi:hypothetical protein ACFXTH_006061 [Malus domestica]